MIIYDDLALKAWTQRRERENEKTRKREIDKRGRESLSSGLYASVPSAATGASPSLSQRLFSSRNSLASSTIASANVEPIEVKNAVTS